MAVWVAWAWGPWGQWTRAWTLPAAAGARSAGCAAWLYEFVLLFFLADFLRDPVETDDDDGVDLVAHTGDEDDAALERLVALEKPHLELSESIV